MEPGGQGDGDGAAMGLEAPSSPPHSLLPEAT